MKKLKIAAFAALAFCSLNTVQSQGLKLPESSPKAEVSMTLGLTEISISYHSPQVEGRKIWGALVPNNQIWRAGANENTTFSASSDVIIEGKMLPAGTYGLHMVPSENEWTIIFSKDNAAWGSYFYKKENDALRVQVKPAINTENQENLVFIFNNLQKEKVNAELRWEKIKVPFSISIDPKNTIIPNLRRQLTGYAGFNADAYQDAATIALNYGDDATANQWLDRSIKMKPGFKNLMTKAEILTKEGKTAEAAELRKKALPMASEDQLNSFGYMLMGQKKKLEALEIFKMASQKYPESWNAYDSLAEAYQANGKKKEAISNYKLALAKAPQDQHSRIESTIKTIEQN